jgi:hypothetical protein
VAPFAGRLGEAISAHLAAFIVPISPGHASPSPR